ncbi:MAG: hypothetical protein DI582_02635 [Azospirillum brasilense]|nr:MAG: hypothetical protein DI582_02635 [Azospirillum brasilense]
MIQLRGVAALKGGGATPLRALHSLSPLALRATHRLHQRCEDTARGQEPEPAMSPRSGAEASHSTCDLPEQPKVRIQLHST